jgi:hypothetical protein
VLYTLCPDEFRRSFVDRTCHQAEKPMPKRGWDFNIQNKTNRNLVFQLQIPSVNPKHRRNREIGYLNPNPKIRSHFRVTAVKPSGKNQSNAATVEPIIKINYLNTKIYASILPTEIQIIICIK